MAGSRADVGAIPLAFRDLADAPPVAALTTNLPRSFRAHLGRFLGHVARELNGERDLVIVGPGEVRQRLARTVRGAAGSIEPDVVVHTEPAAGMTDRQLVALLRDLSGRGPRRGRRSGNEPPASWEPERMRPHPRWPAERRRDRIADALVSAIDG